jgi:DNA-nicking Smr family endonuclease
VRSLSPDEAQLWAKVAATIQPLSREKPAPQPPVKEPESAAETSPIRAPRQSPREDRRSSTPHHRATLDGSWDKRLSSGSVEPDRTIDLHGLSLDAAWRTIDRTLDQAIAAGDRLVLLITGHHRAGDAPVKRGKIRAAVHDWLAVSRHASKIAAVRGAHRRHGGGGSLYLVLRRR